MPPPSSAASGGRFDKWGHGLNNAGMCAAKNMVVHLLAADLPVGKMSMLRALCARDEPAGRHVLVYVGRGMLRAAGLPRPVYVRAVPGLPWLAHRALCHALAGLTPAGPAGPTTIIHIWSPDALAWGRGLARADRRLLVETQLGDEPRRVARWFAGQPVAGAVALVCPTALTQQRLLYFGVPAQRCTLIHESVDLAALERVRVTQLRARLNLAANDKAVVVLPPISRRAGSFIATWAALVLAEARSDVRLIVPAGGREHVHLRRLVHACRRAHRVRFVGAEVSLTKLAGLADLAAFLPVGDVPPTGVPYAMAAGRPLVASAVPAVAEFLTHGQNTWLCRPGDPHDAARRMLQALERADESRRMAERARSQARELFDRERMVAQYADVYAALAAGRDITAGAASAVPPAWTTCTGPAGSALGGGGPG